MLKTCCLTVGISLEWAVAMDAVMVVFEDGGGRFGLSRVLVFAWLFE